MAKWTKKEFLPSLLLHYPWWVMLAIGIVLSIVLWLCPGGSIFRETNHLSLEKNFSILFLFICGMISYISYYLKRSRRLTIDQIKSIESIRNLRWSQFEELVADIYSQMGYIVIEQTENGPDDGFDLELRKGSDRIIVQCKNWNKEQIGVSLIREIFGVLHHEKANRAIFVTTTDYTESALKFAKGKPIELINGKHLVTMFEEVTNIVIDKTEQYVCHIHGIDLVLRTNSRTKDKFWGCPKFPDCKVTMPYIGD